MIRFVCKNCDKKLAVKDEYAGRASKCPSCGEELWVPLQSVREENPAPPPPPRKPTPAAKAVPSVSGQIQTSEDDDETQPNRPPAKPGDEKRRPLWKDPMVVIGAAVPTLILTVFFGYLYVEYAAKQFESRIAILKTEADDLARSGKSLAAIAKHENILAMVHEKQFGAGRYRPIIASSEAERDRLRAVLKEEAERQEQDRRAEAENERLAAEDKSGPEQKKLAPVADYLMPAVAESFIRLHIRLACENAGAEEATIQTIEIKPSPPDARRIPWLWRATASLAVTHRADKPGLAAIHEAIAWTGLFQFTPEYGFGECWREVTSPLDGSKTRKHFDLSEWTPEFRAAAFDRWLPKFQEYDSEVAGDSSRTRTEKQEILQEFKEDVAGRLKITVEELEEILASPAPLSPRPATSGASMAGGRTQSNLPAAPEPPPKPPTIEEQVLAECKRKWAQAQREAKARTRMGKYYLGPSKEAEYLRARKSEIIGELAKKYGLSRAMVKAIVQP